MQASPGVARWRRIYRALAEAIAAGDPPPGGRLATEVALARRFDVNRHTVRRAVAALQDVGLVRVEQGRGTFVQDTVIDYPVSTRTRFSEVVVGADREPQSALIHTECVAAAGVGAGELGVEPGTPLRLLETLHNADDRPISLTAHYFPEARCPGLVEAFRASGSITQALYTAGVPDYFRAHTRVTAREPTAREAHLLQQTTTAPVLETESVNIDGAGRPIEYAVGEAQPVTIEVYNVLGQRVRTLVDERKEAGVHTRTWDGTNRYGTRVGSGVYFYRMEAGDVTETKKMVLVR